jgi:4-hydroxybenzoate polyprenyltransferase
VLVVAVLLAYEHSLVKAGDLSKLDAAFFTMNGIISLLLFGFVLAGRLYVAWTALPHGAR